MKDICEHAVRPWEELRSSCYLGDVLRLMWTVGQMGGQRQQCQLFRKLQLKTRTRTGSTSIPLANMVQKATAEDTHTGRIPIPLANIVGILGKDISTLV